VIPGACRLQQISSQKEIAMPRPAIYGDDTRVGLSSGTPKTRLQDKSVRRAIVNLIIDNKGALTIGQINDHFGFDLANRVGALVRSGWLEVKSESVK